VFSSLEGDGHRLLQPAFTCSQRTCTSTHTHKVHVHSTQACVLCSRLRRGTGIGFSNPLALAHNVHAQARTHTTYMCTAHRLVSFVLFFGGGRASASPTRLHLLTTYMHKHAHTQRTCAQHTGLCPLFSSSEGDGHRLPQPAFTCSQRKCTSAHTHNVHVHSTQACDFSWTSPHDLTDVPLFLAVAPRFWRLPAETCLFLDLP
jgi:hypothetical protein